MKIITRYVLLELLQVFLVALAALTLFMLVVGLVGKIGAGKSTVARLLAAKGADVIDADRIAHEQFADEDVRRAITARFGDGVLAVDGGIDRAALALLVFGPTAAHEAALRDLEAIVHPRVRRRIAADLERLRRADATGSKVAATSRAATTVMSAGIVALRALPQTSAENSRSLVKTATWSSACTPASVRLDPRTSTSSPDTSRTAAVTFPCTVCRSGWICQPE
jgi:dephospho-CoA kinase